MRDLSVSDATGKETGERLMGDKFARQRELRDTEESLCKTAGRLVSQVSSRSEAVKQRSQKQKVLLQVSRETGKESTMGDGGLRQELRAGFSLSLSSRLSLLLL